MTREWVRWVAEQAMRGCSPDSMLEVMAAAGLDEFVSSAVIEGVFSNPICIAGEQQTQLLRKLESVAANVQRLWELDPQYEKVDKRANITEAEFLSRYVQACRPVVLTGHTDDWPAMQRWSPADLKKRFGHLEVEIQADRHANPSYEQDKLSHRRQVRVADFVDQVVSGGASNDYYLTANNEALRKPGFSPLLDDIGTLPPCCDRSQLSRCSSFWFGPAGTITSLHHDKVMLFHTQVVGRKRWRMISPLQTPRLYNTNAVFSPISLDAPDHARFPLFKGVKVLDVIVEPGETIFLPPGWWHQVNALEMSLSFSYTNFALPIDNLFEYFDPAFRKV
ncbi:cupin-like domain-containing protein [Variovorax sp. J22R133]|uniref:cupin-like domain-containing protein n=1 Tax=Variovorax brevis TaxID=3053503 RepID=UPI00257727CD|nr:cupin-like domain-containing protein [Variovorax sp. J22R133]MDM0111846.1 cupin-like domain-containing protein [Variovorax sp. J22R133]